MSETDLMKRIQLALSGIGVRIFRNNVGSGWQGNAGKMPGGAVVLTGARRVNFGLCQGSGDLIGWHSIEITPDMVGCTVAVFVSAEVKTSSGRASVAQQQWRDVIHNAGGIGVIARTVSEAVEFIQSFKPLRK